MMDDKLLIVEGLSKAYQLPKTHQKFRPSQLPLKSLMGLLRKNSQLLWAIQDVSFDLNRGEILGLIGRNGAGKSTLFKLLSRITEPTLGKITLRGRLTSLLEVGIGFHPELTGKENIFLMGAIHGMKRYEIKKRLDEIIAFSQIEKFIDIPVKRYSSGMFVRLAFGVATHMDAQILLIDEVLAIGDFLFQKKCLSKVREDVQKGKAVILVNHNLEVLRQLCQRSLLLDHGRLLQWGETSTVIDTYIKSEFSSSCEWVFNGTENSELTLMRVYLAGPDQKVKNSFRRDEPFFIFIEYQVRTPISQSSVHVRIENTEGALVFYLNDDETHPELLKNRKNGFYKSQIDLPEGCLVTGKYQLIIQLTDSNNHTLHSSQPLSFEVMESSPHLDRPRLMDKKEVLKPFVHWKTEEYR